MIFIIATKMSYRYLSVTHEQDSMVQLDRCLRGVFTATAKDGVAAGVEDTALVELKGECGVQGDRQRPRRDKSLGDPGRVVWEPAPVLDLGEATLLRRVVAEAMGPLPERGGNVAEEIAVIAAKALVVALDHTW